jgi:hypothetical protein
MSALRLGGHCADTPLYRKNEARHWTEGSLSLDLGKMPAILDIPEVRQQVSRLLIVRIVRLKSYPPLS